QSITLTSTTSGGTTPYSYQWYANYGNSADCTGSNGNAISGATSNSYAASPTTTNSYCIKTTDSATTATTNSASVTVTVNPVQSTPTLIPSNVILDSGQTEVYTATLSGGASPYTINFFNVTGGNSAYLLNKIHWLATNAYPTNTEYLSCVTNSNNIYCIDGSTSPGPGTTSAVYYSPVLSSGVVGSWQSTNAYPANTLGQSCITSSNNIYCTGGYTPNYFTNSVYYAPILSSGAVGQWQSTNAYPANAQYLSCASYSNNIYCEGGYVSGSTNAVYYAPIFSSGVVGQWQTANSYPINTFQSSCVTYSNGIYCTGGTINGPSTNAVYYAPIFSSGAIGSWQSATPYPSDISSQSCATLSNNIYCMGGQSSIYTSAAYTAPIASNGLLGQWSAIAAYPANTVGLGCVSNSNSIYCIDGYASPSPGDTNAVYYTSPTTNTQFTYTFVVQSPTSNNAFQYNVIVTDSAATPTTVNSITNTIKVNPVLLAGSITPSSPLIDSGQSVTLTANPSGGSTPYSYQWYADSGCTVALSGQVSQSVTVSPTTTNTYCIKITDSATTSTSNTATDTVNVNPAQSTPTLTPSNVILDSGQTEVYTAALSGGTSPYTVNFFNVTGSKAAYLIGYHGWASANNYPIDVGYGQSCIPYSNTIYCIAGYSSSINNEIKAVYYSPILSSGLLGTWQSTNAYPVNSEGQGCILNSNNIYCVGGGLSGIYTNLVYYAPILSSGVIGAWQATNSYSDNVESPSCTTYSNNIYCIGGYSSIGGAGDSNSAYYAPILSSGVVGAWQAANSYPGNVEYQSCIDNSNNIYCIGGYLNSIGTDTNAVYYAPILSSGAIGSWQSTNAYPANVEGSGCIDYSNSIYCTGGYIPGQGFIGYAYYAPILGSGVVGAWQQTSSYAVNLEYPACIGNTYFIYCVGGYAATSATNSVYYAPISTYGVANQLTWTFIANSPGTNTFQYNVIVTDSATIPTTVNSITNTITVNPALATPTISASNTPSIDTGQYEVFTATESGGTSPYTYDFTVFNSVDNSVLATQSGSSSVFSWQVPASDAGNTIEANVAVTDSASTPVTLNSASTSTITVNQAMTTPSITTPSPSTQQTGNTLTWTTSFTGGISPYTYNWNVYNTVTGTVLANMLWAGNAFTGNSFSDTIPASWVGNTINANVAVTDSASVPVTLNSVFSGTITIVQPVSCTFSISNTVINFGSLDPGNQLSTNSISWNSIDITNLGSTVSNVYIDGTNWGFNTNSFGASNTVWDWNTGTAYTSANQLQVSQADTLTQLTGGNSKNIYFGIGIPTTQPGSGSSSYTQTVSIISVC
ncbi:MAG: hypothetical protein KGI06_05510, partial [Candidatus Micrarchaeota archaeon]|nr:hypothetical protein [Candidatus Micrarchaeota archaeon]